MRPLLQWCGDRRRWRSEYTRQGLGISAPIHPKPMHPRRTNQCGGNGRVYPQRKRWSERRMLHEAEGHRLHGATGLAVTQPFFFPLRALTALADLPRETDPAGITRLRTR